MGEQWLRLLSFILVARMILTGPVCIVLLLCHTPPSLMFLLKYVAENIIIALIYRAV